MVSRSSSRHTVRVLHGLIGIIVLGTACAAHAEGEPYQECYKARHYAAAKYATCWQKARGVNWVVSNPAEFAAAGSKCTSKYRAAWAKLQAKFAGTGTVCEGARFIDNGNGTVTDNLTNLRWEKKTDDATVHDVDDTYDWKMGITPGPEGDGPLFTTFFATLNSGACFAGTCDWRLPTQYELTTILEGDIMTCPADPCIAPVFGPTESFGSYWTETGDGGDDDTVWTVGFHVGTTSLSDKLFPFFVRAVHGGL
jgi:hypothetical protein